MPNDPPLTVDGSVAEDWRALTPPLYNHRRLGSLIGFAYILGVVLQIVVVVLLALRAGGASQIKDDPWVVMASLIAIWIGLLGGPVYLSKKYGSGSLRTDFGFSLTALDVVRGIIIGFGCQLVAGIISYPLLAHNAKLKKQANDATRSLLGGHGFARVMLIGFIVVATPIVEELFFRGLLFRWLRVRKGVAFAVIAGGVLFGLAHILGEPIGVPALIGVGLVLSLTAYYTGRIGSTIVAHGTFNAITVVAQLHNGAWLFLILRHH